MSHSHWIACHGGWSSGDRRIESVASDLWFLTSGGRIIDAADTPQALMRRRAPGRSEVAGALCFLVSLFGLIAGSLLGSWVGAVVVTTASLVMCASVLSLSARIVATSATRTHVRV